MFEQNEMPSFRGGQANRKKKFGSLAQILHYVHFFCFISVGRSKAMTAHFILYIATLGGKHMVLVWKRPSTVFWHKQLK